MFFFKEHQIGTKYLCESTYRLSIYITYMYYDIKVYICVFVLIVCNIEEANTEIEHTVCMCVQYGKENIKVTYPMSTHIFT